eukprot:348221-Amphidinium_carterae.1
MSRLEKEASTEASHKAYCDEETAKTKAKKEELSSDIDSLTAKIDKALAVLRDLLKLPCATANLLVVDNAMVLL